MPTRNVVITAHQAEMLERLVESGRYQNASEVLREGLRLVEQRDAAYEAKLTALRAAVQVGIDAMEAGDFVEFDSDEALDDYFEKLAEDTIAQPAE